MRRIVGIVLVCGWLLALPLVPAQELGPGVAGQDYEPFDPGAYTASTEVDNPWFPMRPGTQLIYEGVTLEEGESIPHRIEFTVTDLVKEVHGVTGVVAFITDHADDELVEAEIAFYAQADDGTVWYLGEYPEEYEEGQLVDAPGWISGVDDAQPGIYMLSDPREGTPSYAQGWAPHVPWTDRGEVVGIQEQNCVPTACYDDVLVIRENSREEPDAYQLKFYARGVGNIRVDWQGDDLNQEVLELVEVRQLDEAAMSEVRERAMELEQRAYENAPEIYGGTQPMTVRDAQP